MQQAWTSAKGLQCVQETNFQRKETNSKERERVETTAVVQGATVKTCEYAEEDYVFVFGDEVCADVQRRETHSCIESGASRLACHFGYASELTTRGTSPPLFSIHGSAIEQRGYKNVH